MVWAAAAALLLATLAAGAASSTLPVDASCGMPVGFELEAGVNAAVPAGHGPEYAALDAVRMPGGQRSPEVMLAAWGHAVLVAEVKVDQGSEFTWAIMARIHSNTSGWNTPPIWLSSPDTSQYYPQGAHIRPSAVLWHERVWVAWDAQGSTLGGPSDRFILLRSFDRNLTADATAIASSSDPNRTTQHPAIAADGAQLIVAYSTADGDAAPADTHIVVRSFDGAAFGSALSISTLSDLWGDGLPALASNGAGGLVVAWNAANETGGSTDLAYAARDGTTWTPARHIASMGTQVSGGPAVAFFKGKAYIAYSTKVFGDVSGLDSEVRWFAFDPATALPGSPQTVNPEPTTGEDTLPTLTVLSGGLAVGWSTTEDTNYSHSSDSDPVFRMFDGEAWGPVFELSVDSDNASDGAPSFFELGGHLYGHWMLTPPQQPGDPRGNSREVVRLVSRPAQWYDNLSLSYSIPQVAENGSAKVYLEPDARLDGHVVLLQIPDGTFFELTADGAGRSAWVPLNPAAPDFKVLACGLQASVLPLPPQAAPPPAPPYGLIAAAVAVGVVLSAVGLRGRAGNKPPSGP